MPPSQLSPDQRLLAVAHATVRPMPAWIRELPTMEMCEQAQRFVASDPPERMAGLTAEAIRLIHEGVNPLVQWPALWDAARTDWLKAVIATLVEQEEEGRPFRTAQGETVLHWLAQESALHPPFNRLSFPRDWMGLQDARGDLPLHAVWHPVHGIQGRIEAILRGPERQHWNAYERLDEAIETTEELLAGGADWEAVNAAGETASDRLLAARDAGVFRWLNNNADVAWIEPVLEAKAQQRRLKALDAGLPAPVASIKTRF